MFHVFSDWSGKYSDSNLVFLTVLQNGAKNEMIITIHQNNDFSPPSLVTRIHPVKFTFPLPRCPNPTFSVVRSDYKNIASEKVLQKIQIVNDSAPFKTDDVTVTVSEYVIVCDFFDEIPPDDVRKCKRKFKIRKKRNEVTVTSFLEHSDSREVLMRKVEEVGADKLDKMLKIIQAEDRGIAVAEASKLFRLFHEEMWLYNDGILGASLDKIENEIKLGIFSNAAQEMQNEEYGTLVYTESDVREHDGLVEEKSEDEDETDNFAERTGIVSDDYNEVIDSLITEDELWERRNFDD